jgi:NAD(P)-dependent dehydrogenase (short-subunit alcohol dehydrogenase family)
MNVTIIGIGSDIGRELAKRFVSDGARVQGTYLNTKPDLWEFEQAGPFPGCASVHLVHCDVTNHNHCRQMPNELEPWDLLIFCPGKLSPVKSFFECDPFEWRESFRVNCLGPLMLLYYLKPLKREAGQVVFFSGTNPFKTNPNYSAYSASKAALMTAMKEINGEGTRAFAIAPGFMQTKIHKATLDAGVENERLKTGGGITHDKLFSVLKRCLKSDKAPGQVMYAPDCGGL